MLIDHTLVILVDDDADVRESTRKLLALSGLPCLALPDAAQALATLPPNWPGVLISDVCMPDMDGEVLLQRLQQQDPHLPVILFTGHGDIPMAVRAVRAGAFEFLEKPVSPALLLECVHRALKQRQDFLAARSLRAGNLAEHFPGQHPLAVQLRERVLLLAETDLPVFICGENGTGRRTLAEHLHHHGKQAGGALIKLSAGHLGQQDHASLEQNFWQAAQGGSLLLIDPEHLPALVQHLLANWLLENSIERQVRPLAISSLSPQQAVSDGLLRPDLYYALSAAQINTPSLRQRREDIPELFRYLVRQSCQRLQKPIPLIDESFVGSLGHAAWPGNMRELRNVADMYAIGLARLENLGRTIPLGQEQTSLDEQLDRAEKSLIEEALSLHCGRVSETADYLHIPRKKLYLRMKKHDLDKAEFKP